MLFNVLLTTHIIGGFTALFMAAAAVLTKTFNFDHKWHIYSGRLYHWGMIVVFVTALPMTYLHPNLFLFLIAIFSYYSAFTGWRLAKNRKGTPTWIEWGSGAIMAITAVGMVAYGGYLLAIGISDGVTILVFGVIGGLTARADLRMYRAGGVKGKDRIIEHLGKMLGATIATLTAFVVTNFVFEPAFVLWLAPTALIVPIIVWWSRQVRNGRQILFK